MKRKNIKVNVNKCVTDLTMVIEITGMKRFKIKMFLITQLFKLCQGIARPMNINIKHKRDRYDYPNYAGEKKR